MFWKIWKQFLRSTFLFFILTLEKRDFSGSPYVPCTQPQGILRRTLWLQVLRVKHEVELGAGAEEEVMDVQVAGVLVVVNFTVPRNAFVVED